MLCSDSSKYKESSNKNLKEKEPPKSSNLDRMSLRNFFHTEIACETKYTSLDIVIQVYSNAITEFKSTELQKQFTDREESCALDAIITTIAAATISLLLHVAQFWWQCDV